jgi:3-hydroxyisobutyrate dehydrogenase-like beta-hydroxyacid dehydrogenase
VRVGVVGVGNLGHPIAERCLAAGMRLAVLDANPQAAQELAARGAIVCDSPEEMAREADIILLVVRTAEQVEDVLFGPSGIAKASGPETLICVVSTISLDDLQRVAERARQHALGLVDTAIGGGGPLVAEGRAAAMVGGTEADHARIAQVFSAFCGDIIHVPGIGGGMRLKLIKNHLSYLSMMVGMEAVMLSRAADIDLSLVRRVIDSSDLVQQFLFLYLDSGEIDPPPGDAPPAQVATQRAMADLCRKDLSAARDLAAVDGAELLMAKLVEQCADRLFRVPGSDAPSNSPFAKLR